MSTPDDPRALAALYRLASLGNRTTDAHEALREVLDTLVATFRADSGSIALLNPNSGRLEVEVQHGLPEDNDPGGLKLGHGVTGWCVLNARSLLVPDVGAESRYIAVRPTARCEMAVPMSEGDQVLGVIDLESDRREGFTSGDLALLERLTVEATGLVLQLWRTRHLEAKARQLETLLTTGQSLVAKLETQELFDTLTREASRMMQAQFCAVYLHDAVKSTACSVAVCSTDPAAGDPPQREFAMQSALVTSAFHTRRQVEFVDVQSPGFNDLADLPSDRSLRSVLYTPLIHEGEVFAVLAVFLGRLHRFDDDEKRACATLANLGAVALQNARLYARVFESEERLRKNEQLTTLGLLAAEIAHEIRNPLTVIKLLHGALDPDFPADDPRRTDMRVIDEKLDQLESIVLRVLNFAKAPAALHSRWSLAEVVADTLVLVRPKLAQAQIHLRYEPTSKILLVDAHKGQLQQVLINLIFNSTEAMARGGELAIVLGEQTRGGVSFATLDVIDNGSGIPPELAPRIFDSFLTGRPGGTGLGLAIAKRILESHHGEITLIATGPTGTTLRITLPFAKN